MEATESSKQRVSWTEEEATVLALRILQLQAIYPDMRLIKAFRKAQDELLPVQRHRQVPAWSMVAGRLEPRMQALKQSEGFAAHIAECLAAVERKRAQARQSAARRSVQRQHDVNKNPASRTSV